jgi:hypothetical protein
MKKVYLFLNLLLVTSLAFAQLPQSGKNYNIRNVGANLYLSYVTNDWNVSRNQLNPVVMQTKYGD